MGRDTLPPAILCSPPRDLILTPRTICSRSGPKHSALYRRRIVYTLQYCVYRRRTILDSAVCIVLCVQAKNSTVQYVQCCVYSTLCTVTTVYVNKKTDACSVEVKVLRTEDGV